MYKPGKRNSICDVAGLRVGNAQDDDLKSGVTAVLCDLATVASVSVMGGAPGTRDIALLEPEQSVEHVDGLFLSGGSAFGVDAGSGVQAFLREHGKGFEVMGQFVPIAPGAILFDLINGGNKNWGKFSPYADLGYEAAASAAREFDLGSVGAGSGALVANLKGGLGTASTVMEDGTTIAALVAVNALGSPCVGNTNHFWAAPFEIDGEFGGLGLPSPMPKDADHLSIKFRDKQQAGQNTTIGMIATDANLTKAQCKRLATAAHDGYARALWPTHTPLDGDLVFGLATGQNSIAPAMDQWIDYSAIAASTMARAIARGIHAATPAKSDLFPVWNALP